MRPTASPPARRTFLKKLLLLLGGGAGLAAVAPAAPGGAVVPAGAQGPPAAPESARTLALHGRWTPSTVFGAGQPSADRGVRRGVILDGPGGEALGELYANTFAQPGPFGPISPDSSPLELQTLCLRDGTLFGLGAPVSGACEARAFAVLGGTGRFAGARGSYVERPTACDARGASAAEFTIYFS
jgi:hypothetical protein